MRPRLRFRTKIFLALGGLVCLSIGAALAVTERLTSRQLEREFEERFTRTLAAFRELQALRTRFVADQIDALARANPQFRTILSTASLASDLGLGGSAEAGAAERDANLRLRSLVPSLALAEKSEVLVVLDASGRLLYSHVDPERAGDDLSGLALFAETVAGGGAEGVWAGAPLAPRGARLVPEASAPAVYHVLGRPVVFEDAIHGVVLAGQRLDRAALESIRAASGVHLALQAEGALVASTLEGPARRDLAARLGDPAPEWALGGERFLGRRAEVAPGVDPSRIGFVVLASSDAALAFLRRLQASLLGAGVAILAGALLPALVLARGITRPVAALARAARRLGAGELDARVAIASGDELGELGRAFNEMASGLAERDRLRRTFERYVSPHVAAEILRHPEVVPVGGVRREATVSFCDLVGFAGLAESLDPELVLRCLNEYFEAACAPILERDGTVNQFLGDAVLAFWGAPLVQPDHAARACLAALACRDRLAALGGVWAARGLGPLRFRMGLHTGEIVIGEIGSLDRRSYAAVGDAMNLASRIEGANRVYATALLVSGATREGAGEAVVAREIDRVRVIGRRQPVSLHELIAPAGALDAARAQRLERFAEALAAYRRRDYAAAERGFAACVAEDASDGPSRVLLARARAFRAAPPPADWDGVHELEVK